MRGLLLGISLAAVVMFAAVGADAQSESGKGEAPAMVEGATLVTPAEAKVLWDKGVAFVDVRGPSLWADGRIPGANFLEYVTDYNEATLKKVAKLNDEVVIYCGGPG